MSYPNDNKLPVEGLPVFHIDESTEVLVVGGEQRRGCCRAGSRKSKACRAIKFVLSAFVLLFVAGAAFKFFRHRPVPLFCNDIVDLSEPVTVKLPLGCPHRPARLLLHSSLAANEATILHDDDIPAGEAQVTIEWVKAAEVDEDEKSALIVQERDEEDKPPVVCAIKGKMGIGLGVFSLTDEAAPKVAKTVIRYSSKVGAPALRFIGEKEFKFKERHIKRLIRWWKKRHDKKEESESK